MKLDGIPIAFTSGLRIPSLEAFHDHLLDTSAKIIADGDEVHGPMIFILSRAGQVAVIPPVGSKEGIARFQQAVVQEPMVRACALVFEAWMSTHPKEVDRKSVPMPRDDPKRQEAIVVSIMTNGRQAMSFSPITRPANTLERAPFKWLDEIEGAKHKGRFVR